MSELARETGIPVYLVGGPVRDALLGASALDLDFAVEGDAVALARRLPERLALQQVQDVRVTAHARFGTATVFLPSSQGENERGRIDLVTARRESYRKPGQLPRVTPSNIGDDLARRDFSINAMALPLSAPDAGLFDPLGGLDDLKAGAVRALHPLSFVDDPTRMMRAVRYEQRFGFDIDQGTLGRISDAVLAGPMNAVSGDRWRHELERILDEANPVAPLLRAVELGLLAGLHPAWGRLSIDGGSDLRRLAQSVPAHPQDKKESLADESLAALFSPLTAIEGEGIIQRLRFSGRRAALARDTIELRESEPRIRACAGRPSQLARMLAGRESAAISFWAKNAARPVMAGALRRYAGELRFIKPELSGAALLEMGVPQGPLVGEILARLRDARLDGAVTNRDEETALARALLDGGRAK